MWRLSPRQQAIAERILERLEKVYFEASAGDDKLATALVARFMARMLRVVRSTGRRENADPVGPTSDVSQSGLDDFLFPPDMVSWKADPLIYQQLAFRPFVNPVESLPVQNDEQYW